MRARATLLASTFAIAAAMAPQAKAEIVYTVFNPAMTPTFVLFVYNSPGFITTDTTVDVAQLTFANPANTITSVEFLPSSNTFPGTSELDVFQSGGGADQTFAGNQFRYYPLGTFTQYGVTAGDSNSFGFPNSMLSVAAPEPSTIALLATGLAGLFGLRRRAGGKA